MASSLAALAIARDLDDAGIYEAQAEVDAVLSMVAQVRNGRKSNYPPPPPLLLAGLPPESPPAPEWMIQKARAQVAADWRHANEQLETKGEPLEVTFHTVGDYLAEWMLEAQSPAMADLGHLALLNAIFQILPICHP